jgi:uncharacterized protein (TIGR02246 family)
MRRAVESCVISCVVAVLLGSCTASQKPAVDTAAIKSAIADFNQKFAAAVAARDTDTVANSYADDAHLLPAGSPRSDGREAIRAAWVQFLGTPGLSLKFTSSDVMVAEAGDVAIDVGAYEMSMSGPKGQPIQDVGKYVTVLKKVGDQWKIVVDTFNSDKPMPGA